MSSYTLVYYDADWHRDGLCWHQTLFQRITANETVIVSLVRTSPDASPTIERAGLFASIHDKRGQQWKLIGWIQPDEIVLVKG